MGLLGFLGILGAIGWLLTAKKPIVNLASSRTRTSRSACVMIGAMGVILYASSVVIPQFAQQVLGYTATLAGLILSPGGIVVIMLIPIVGALLTACQTRYIVTFGFFADGLRAALLQPPGARHRLQRPGPDAQRADGALAFMFVPISTIAYPPCRAN